MFSLNIVLDSHAVGDNRDPSFPFTTLMSQTQYSNQDANVGTDVGPDLTQTCDYLWGQE